MADTTHLTLPLLAAAQAQKHVTHNDALLRLDAIVQLAVIDRDLTDPPADPSDGDRYIPASGATGAWADWDLNIAWFVDGVWTKLVPREGWRVWVEDEDVLLVWDGAEWQQLQGGGSGLIFTPGGDGEVSIYRNDATSGQNPRTATISSVSGDTITLTASVASSIFDDLRMGGVSYIRIWNTSKSPDQSAWVVAQPAADQLQVLDSGDIAGWSGSETIQLGDPTDVTPNRCMALDISPMLQNVLGGVFRQSGIMVKAGIRAATAGDDIGLSPSGVGGSFVAAARVFADDTFAGTAVSVIPCTEPSPVSSSNLVFVRETIATTGTVRLLSAIAVFG